MIQQGLRVEDGKGLLTIRVYYGTWSLAGEGLGARSLYTQRVAACS